MSFTRSMSMVLMAAAFLPPVTSQIPIFGNLHGMLPADADRSQAVAVGDVDGDGDADIVIGNEGGFIQGSAGQNRLLLNDGHGRFIEALNALPVDNDLTQAVVLGDVDGDGDMDAFIGNYGQNRLYLNDGTGVFTDATSQLPAHSDDTAAVALGDVDGDGDLDAVLGNFLFQQNRLYLNNGNGTFIDVTLQLPQLSDPTTSVVLADVDGDGDLDLLEGNGFDGIGVPNRLSLNNGLGLFSDATAQLLVNTDVTASLSVADIDGDGDVDVLVGNGPAGFLGGSEPNRIYINNGAGVFSSPPWLLPPDVDSTASIALGDVDGDGDLDAILANVGPNRLYLNNGAGVFTTTTTAFPSNFFKSTAVALLDLDADGDLDAVIASPFEHQNQLYLNDGQGNFVDATAPLPSDRSRTHAVVFGDIDADGDLDVLLGNFGQNQLLVNDGAGFYVDAMNQIPTTSNSSTGLALGDVDADGDVDAIIGNGAGQPTALLLNDGGGTFSDASFLLPALSVDSSLTVALGDMDGDGDLDIYLGRFAGPDVLLLNTGNGNFNGPMGLLPSSTGSVFAVALGDLDGDGDLDVFRGSLPPFLNNGNASFTAGPTPPSVTSAFPRVALGDVDGDGDLDALVGSAGLNGLLLNNGTATFSDASFQLPPHTDNTTSVAFADVDGDGDLDSLVGNIGTLSAQQNRLYLNDGTGVFSDATSLIPQLQDRTQALALGDVDGDGDLDAFIGNNDGTNRLLRNLTRQVAWRALPRAGKPLTMDLFGSPFALWILGVSGGTVQIPTAIGTLLIDPASLFLIGSDTLNFQGRSSLTLLLPGAPALVGLTVYWQAALGTPLGLSNLERTTVSGL